MTRSRYDLVGSSDAGQCRTPFKLGTYPSDVDSFKARVAVIAYGVHVSVASCPQLPERERLAWNTFYVNLVAFCTRPTALFGTYGEWVETCTLSRELDARIEKLRGWCEIAGPDPKQIDSSVGEDILKIGIAGAAVLGAAALLLVFAPEIKALAATRRK